VRLYAGWYIRLPEAGSPSAAGFMLKMLKTRQIIVIITGVLGVLLVAKGAWGGVWPLSIQLIAGVLLLVFAGLRWWTMR
jgi:hypothetical protein